MWSNTAAGSLASASEEGSNFAVGSGDGRGGVGGGCGGDTTTSQAIVQGGGSGLEVVGVTKQPASDDALGDRVGGVGGVDDMGGEGEAEMVSMAL